MNEKQQALIKIAAQVLHVRPEEVTPSTRVGYLSEHIVTLFAFLHLHSLQVADIENCTVDDLLKQLA